MSLGVQACNTYTRQACNTYTRRDQVRPIPGMWVQSIPVTAIPWGRIKTEQHNLVIRSKVENEMSMKFVAWGMKTGYLV
jgi:hypothetical protein